MIWIDDLPTSRAPTIYRQVATPETLIYFEPRGSMDYTLDLPHLACHRSRFSVLSPVAKQMKLVILVVGGVDPKYAHLTL